MGISKGFHYVKDKVTDKWSGRAQNEKISVISQDEINRAGAYLKRADAFLTFQGKDPLSAALLEGFHAWQELYRLRKESELAEIVLSAFYQQGKIRDILLRAQDFANQLEPDGNTEAAREKGYNNYIYFLGPMIAGMKEHYSEKQAEETRDLPLTPDNAAWFIRSECGSIPTVQDLPKYRAAMGQLLPELRAGQEKTQQFIKAFSGISTAIHLLHDYPENDVLRLKARAAELKARVHAVRQTIEKGRAVYVVLTRVMTQEWLDAFNPEAEDSLTAAMTRQELKEFYLERIGQIESRLPFEQES